MKEMKENVKFEGKELKESEVVESKEINNNNIEIEDVVTKLFVERERVVIEGRAFWNYKLKGTIRDRQVHVDFIPKDSGGYEVLDIVYSIADNNMATLVMTTESMTDALGKKTKYVSYKVVNTDKIGTLECYVKPARDSDKTLLSMILAEIDYGRQL